MQYRNGQFISTGAAVTLMLGFVPDKIQIYNYTVLSADSGAHGHPRRREPAGNSDPRLKGKRRICGMRRLRSIFFMSTGRPDRQRGLE